MESQIKRAIKSGNSSAVILPRAWLNQEVRIELIKKTPEKILAETMNIANDYIDFREIIGVYLVGSYARGEEDENSDIDILIITSNTSLEMIKEGIYNILVVSKDLVKQKLKTDLFPLGQMIREARPLLNSDYLSSINIEVTKENISWYLKTTEEKIDLIKRVMDFMISKEKVLIDDKLVYTLILRIRTLYIIKNLMEKKDYSKKDFINLITRTSNGTNSYESYLVVKNDLKSKSKTSLEEVERLYEYLKKQFSDIKKVLK